MNWGKHCHNRRHMSKRYHMTSAHYQADSAPRRDAKKRREELIASLKDAEKQRQIADKAANVAAAAQAVAVKAALLGDVEIGMTAEEIERIAEKVRNDVVGSVRAAILQSKRR